MRQVTRHTGEVWEGPQCGGVFVELGCTTFPAHEGVHQPVNSPDAILLRFVQRRHHVGINH